MNTASIPNIPNRVETEVEVENTQMSFDRKTYESRREFMFLTNDGKTVKKIVEVKIDTYMIIVCERYDVNECKGRNIFR